MITNTKYYLRLPVLYLLHIGNLNLYFTYQFVAGVLFEIFDVFFRWKKRILNFLICQSSKNFVLRVVKVLQELRKELNFKVYEANVFKQRQHFKDISKYENVIEECHFL